MESERPNKPLEYATPTLQQIPAYIVKLNTTYIIAITIGALMIAIAFADARYAAFSIGGCVLVGSGLISLAITNSARR